MCVGTRLFCCDQLTVCMLEEDCLFSNVDVLDDVVVYR